MNSQGVQAEISVAGAASPLYPGETWISEVVPVNIDSNASAGSPFARVCAGDAGALIGDSGVAGPWGSVLAVES